MSNPYASPGSTRIPLRPNGGSARPNTMFLVLLGLLVALGIAILILLIVDTVQIFKIDTHKHKEKWDHSDGWKKPCILPEIPDCIPVYQSMLPLVITVNGTYCLAEDLERTDAIGDDYIITVTNGANVVVLFRSYTIMVEYERRVMLVDGHDTRVSVSGGTIMSSEQKVLNARGIYFLDGASGEIFDMQFVNLTRAITGIDHEELDIHGNRFRGVALNDDDNSIGAVMGFSSGKSFLRYNDFYYPPPANVNYDTDFVMTNFLAYFARGNYAAAPLVIVEHNSFWGHTPLTIAASRGGSYVAHNTVVMDTSNNSPCTAMQILLFDETTINSLEIEDITLTSAPASPLLITSAGLGLTYADSVHIKEFHSTVRVLFPFYINTLGDASGTGYQVTVEDFSLLGQDGSNVMDLWKDPTNSVNMQVVFRNGIISGGHSNAWIQGNWNLTSFENVEFSNAEIGLWIQDSPNSVRATGCAFHDLCTGVKIENDAVGKVKVTRSDFSDVDDFFDDSWSAIWEAGNLFDAPSSHCSPQVRSAKRSSTGTHIAVNQIPHKNM